MLLPFVRGSCQSSRGIAELRALDNCVYGAAMAYYQSRNLFEAEKINELGLPCADGIR